MNPEWEERSRCVFRFSIEEVAVVNTVMMIVFGVTWLAILGLGFLLLGTLRALGVLTWRLDQLEATTPRRVGRDGLAPGKRAPDFTLPSFNGQDVSLRDFTGRKVLLVFVQPGCGPCHAIVPELNRLASRGDEVQVLAINNGTPEDVRKWAAETGARFPVVAQQALSVSKRYEVFATPFAFLIDEQTVVRSKGLVTSKQHLGYVISGAGDKGREFHAETERNGRERGEFQESVSSSTEVSHV
jgi:methylamine dehydrogenase accessory protein MauD